MLTLVALGAWLAARNSLQPIKRLTEAIANVTVRGLDQRIPIGTSDLEFSEPIKVFNQMLERLERSFTQASRFSADAAHELKTPLAILQGKLEWELQQAELESKAQQGLSELLDQVRRLREIVRKLLLLSLADAGRMGLHLVEVDLSEILMEMLEDIELLVPDLTIFQELNSKLLVRGDRDLLIQIFQNLISNAIKYNLPKGWIRIKLHKTTKMAIMTISNASHQLPKDQRKLIFERFHRGDPQHSHKIEGSGLGLSLAREIAKAHGGDLAIEPLNLSALNQASFSLSLPLSLAE
jgi:two-component system, OmpR family, heavy metal sensor histidine kinase CusS